MYGDPARIAEGYLERYTDGLRIPGTMQHILAIVDCWFADMAKLEATLLRIAQVPTLLVWGDRDPAVDPASAAPLHSILRQSELRIVPRRRPHPLRGDARGVEPHHARLVAPRPQAEQLLAFMA